MQRIATFICKYIQLSFEYRHQQPAQFECKIIHQESGTQKLWPVIRIGGAYPVQSIQQLYGWFQFVRVDGDCFAHLVLSITFVISSNSLRTSESMASTDAYSRST